MTCPMPTLPLSLPLTPRGLILKHNKFHHNSIKVMMFSANNGHLVLSLIVIFLYFCSLSLSFTHSLNRYYRSQIAITLARTKVLLCYKKAMLMGMRDVTAESSKASRLEGTKSSRLLAIDLFITKPMI